MKRGLNMEAELVGLLAGLHERPDDDALWLVTSDWLEEHGQPGPAELMRLVRQMRGLKEGKKRLEMESRVWALLAAGVQPLMPTLTNSVGMDLVLIPPGELLTGSPTDEEGRYDDESPRRKVPMPAYYMGRTAVTQRQYFTVAGKRPSGFKSTGRMKQRVEGMDTSDFPVERVSWHDASAFCALLNDLPAEKDAGRVYRLPTELEWEYACRGEASRMAPYPHGAEISPKLVNYKAGSERSKSYLGRPVPCGSLPPNAFGLHEMTGNTWEWCGDWNADRVVVPPAVAEESGRRNARGGTYGQEARRARTADRSSFDPDHRDHDMGFRVLLEWRGAEAPKKRRGR